MFNFLKISIDGENEFSICTTRSTRFLILGIFWIFDVLQFDAQNIG